MVNALTRLLTRKQKASTSLSVESRAISTLIPDMRNARQHSPKQIGQVARSIQAFGFNVPVLIDQTLRIIAGHGRVEAARSLGMAEVPTIQIAHLSDAQRRAFMIADNRLTETSTWNETLLGQELKFLSEADLDFSVEITGFEMAEIDLMIDGLEEKTELDEADALPVVASKAISKPGDLWLLGKHRLLCGDALVAANLENLMDAERANVVFTDPPYNVAIDGHATGNGRTRHRNFAMASGEMSKEQFTAFLSTSLKLAAKHSVAGSLHFVCMDWRHVGELLEAGGAAYTELKNICVWTKTSAGMGSLYRSQHEFVFVFKSGKSAHRNNIELGKYGRYRTNVWSYPGANSFNNTAKGEKPLDLHPTVKPTALVADAILDCSARGDLVLDPFLGSGTTILAAERTGRFCHGLELDSLYVDVAIRRWQTFTGKSAPTLSRVKPFARWRKRLMAPKKKNSYTVGYGKPPIETRFPAGVSGNPRGRPKHSINVRTTLTRILSEKVLVTQNGEKTLVTKFEAAMTKLAHKAIEGDMRATSHICALMLSAEESDKTEQPTTAPLGRSETRLLQDLMQMRPNLRKDKADA